MPWFKVDDSFYDHPKFLDVPNAAVGLWTKAGAWCAKHLTDGVISAKCVRALGGTPAQIKALIKNGLWEEHPHGYKFVHWRKNQDGKYRKNIRKSVKRAVYERDGHRCVFCGATENLSLDHIVRYADDGPDTEDNLRVLCMKCNQSRETKRRCKKWRESELSSQSSGEVQTSWR